VALRTTCIKNVKLKIVKTRTGCQYTGYCYYRENLIWAAQNLNWAAGWTWLLQRLVKSCRWEFKRILKFGVWGFWWM